MTTTTHPQVLTPRQAEALDLIVQFEAQHDRQPTPTELSRLFVPTISAASAGNLMTRIQARLNPHKAKPADPVKQLPADTPKVTVWGQDHSDLLDAAKDFLDELSYLTPTDKVRRDNLRERIAVALEAP